MPQWGRNGRAVTNPHSVVTTLPGLAQGTLSDDPLTPGELEARVRAQCDALAALGYVEAHHAGLVQLAITTAREIDWTLGRGAPSGRANLFRVMNEILEQLPHPVAASADKLDDVLAALRGGGDASAGT